MLREKSPQGANGVPHPVVYIPLAERDVAVGPAYRSIMEAKENAGLIPIDQ